MGNRDKKVLIIISDGGDNASNHKLAEIVAMVGQPDVIIYTIGIFDDQDSDRNPGVLKRETGNSGIAGHRDTFFRELKDIQLSDEIQMQTATGLFRYQVDWMKVVEPSDTSVLEPSDNESTVTLVTCYPFYFVGSAPKRFVVRAHSINLPLHSQF